MPTASPDPTVTQLDTPVTITVLTNDTGTELAIIGYTQPSAGSLVLNPDRSFTYTPSPGFVGEDGFTYTVRDDQGATATAMVVITVRQANLPPTAGDDTAAVVAGASVVLSVMDNDGDPDRGPGDEPLSLVTVEAPGHGTVQIEPGGERLRYTPQAGFVGTDSFAYTVGDGAGAVATANVTIVVTNENVGPTAASDEVVTAVGASVTIDVLANDDDSDGGTLTLSQVGLPAHGTLAVTPEQRFVYTPEPGFEGEDGFTYTVRDGGGLTATGNVKITVERRNTPPVAAADSAISVGGAQVRLDLLANDNDPDGDPLRLTALDLPVGGRIAVNPDQSVTYTPEPGFAGLDRFTYTMSDGLAEATAEAVIQVQPAEGQAFANGYRQRRRLLFPGRPAAGETVQDVVVLVQETRDWLRATSAGGKVESEQGFDVRFELADGTKLDHELERFEPVTGALTAWVRIPSWPLAQAQEILLYYGKPGLAASEANPTGTWRGYLAVWDTRTGVDRSGQGRNLQPANVTDGSLIAGCGRFDGNAVAVRPDAGFLTGLDELTLQALVQPDPAMVGSDHGVLAQGPMDGNDGSAGLGLGYRAAGEGGAEAVVAFTLRCADGATQALSPSASHATVRQLLHGTWRRGEAPRLYVDGAPGPVDAAGPVRGGATALPAGGLHLGAGARDPAGGGWRGLIDEVRVRGSALPASWIALERANLAAPQATYGLGGEDLPSDPDQSPVALPLTLRVTVGGHADLDPLASVLDLDGGSLALTALDLPGEGKATIVDGRIRYTPRAGFVGTDSFTYTVSSGTKHSTALVTVAVTLPMLQAIDDTVTTAAEEAVVIDVLANDEGANLALLEIDDPAHGTAAANAGGSITYRPDPGFVGSDSFTYRVGNELGSSTATVAVTVTDGAADLPYTYIHKPADSLLPASDSDIVVWNVPAAGGTCPHTGNVNQVLLMVAPSGPIRGAVSATGLHFKAVFLIGATFRPQGITSLLTPGGAWVRGGDVLRIGFASGIAARPVLFLANVDYDARNEVEDNVFGGFLQAGTARPPASAGDPDGSSNRERWVDLYLQKIKVAHGSYSFTGSSGSLVSSFFQPRLGGIGDLYGGQLDLRWHGPAFSMLGQPAPRDTLRPDARLILNRVALRAMPPSSATGDELAAPVALRLIAEAGSPEAALALLERGQYQAAFLDGVELERYAGDAGSLEPYFVPGTAPGGATLRYDSLRQRIGFPVYRTPGRVHPVWTGEIAVAASARAMVSGGEVGAALRVTTAAKLREILMPRLDLRASDDQVTVARGGSAVIDILANDVGANGAALNVEAPAQGAVALTPDRQARYTAPAGFVGEDSFRYTLTQGARSSTATVRVTVSQAPAGAWGMGPRSGDRWWTGFGDVTGNSLGVVGNFERLRNRPVDLIAIWAPKNQIDSWDDLAGGPGDDETLIGGTLTLGVNNKRVIWDNPATRALPIHLNLTLVPPPFSNRNAANPGIWWDYAAGAFDIYWRRLGKRMAYLDDQVDRTAPLILDLGWEHSATWYPWSISGSRNGTPAYTQFPAAFARMVAAVRAGYYSYASRNCPYRFCWRPARVTVANGVHHTAFYPGDEVVDLIGISNHERDPYLTPTNWSSRTSPWPNATNFTRQGWDHLFNFCANRGKQACFPEWGPIESHPEYEPSRYPEEMFRLTRSYIEARLGLFAYDCYFNGDEAKITANPTWPGTLEYKRLWGRQAG